MISSHLTGFLRHPLILVLVFTLAGCQQQPSPAASKTDQPSTDVATSTAGDIGIAECDDYLNKYQACVLTKAPASARATLKQSLDQTRTVWRTASATPGGKAGLAAACKQVSKYVKPVGPHFAHTGEWTDLARHHRIFLVRTWQVESRNSPTPQSDKPPLSQPVHCVNIFGPPKPGRARWQEASLSCLDELVPARGFPFVTGIFTCATKPGKLYAKFTRCRGLRTTSAMRAWN